MLQLFFNQSHVLCGCNVLFVEVPLFVCVLCPKFTQKYLVRGLPKISVFACFIRLSVKGFFVTNFLRIVRLSKCGLFAWN